MIDYIEKKSIDWEDIEKSLIRTSELNQWTNFGPASLKLERTIHDYLSLPSNKCVVACASGTVALHALVNLYNVQPLRECKPLLRWVVSSYTFACAKQGPLRTASVADCTADSMLDLNSLDSNNFDGVIVTDVFGLCKDRTPYIEYCKNHDKFLIMDSAMALDNVTGLCPEIISFHHTKPWGIGEGGCAILDTYHEKTFRSLISCGTNADSTIYGLATNGKMSDIAAACILQRLRTVPKGGYQHQFRRILEIGLKMGISPLPGCECYQGTPSCVPFLFEQEVSNLTNPYVRLGKYYSPLAPTKIATNLYSRIVNFPCHPQISALPDAQIKEVFKLITPKRVSVL